ncbi:MAG: MEDS domain-containing protein [Actinobacteria bacterium]|nr:MEDS domain-containing protein [Actinomycetota bacterium]
MHFYDRASELAGAVGRYISDALISDATVLIVATPPHRAAFDEWLAGHDVDVEGALAQGRYVTLDAQALLDRFMVEGRPDPSRFRDVLNRYLDDAPSPVVAFGEMVAILWEQGNVVGALQLEDLWNALGEERRFTLYCAYRAASFANCDDLGAANRVCASHSSVVAPSSYVETELPSVTPSEQAQMFLPVAEAVIGVRRFVAGALALNYSQAVIADSVLVASELATNAVRHALGPFHAVVAPCDHGIRLEFHDACPATPRLRLALTTEVDGRGLAIVDRLAHKWGVDEYAGRKVVWADIVG